MLSTILLLNIGSLFCWDVLLGGYFHGRNHLTYGVDVSKIRWLGVLQVPLLSHKSLLVCLPPPTDKQISSLFSLLLMCLVLLIYSCGLLALYL